MLNERKLKKLQILVGTPLPDNASDLQRNRYQRYYDQLRDFPQKREENEIKYCSERTRLGNVIASYELYPQAFYGFDSVFYWPHLLDCASDETRKEFSTHYQFAESLVLVSSCGALVAVLHTVTIIGFLLSRYLSVPTLFVLGFGIRISVVLLIFGLIVWIAFYQAAVFMFQDISREFRGLVDTAMPKFIEWIQKTALPVPPSTVQKANELRTYLIEGWLEESKSNRRPRRRRH